MDWGEGEEVKKATLLIALCRALPAVILTYANNGMRIGVCKQWGRIKVSNLATN